MPLKRYKSQIERLSEDIRLLVDHAKKQVIRNIDKGIIGTYWEVGKKIIEIEQEHNIDNKSSRVLLIELSRELATQLGRGFSRSNLTYMRLFYLGYPNGVTVSDQLSWSHYIELLKIDNELERGFYEQQTIKENWSLRELKRQKDSALFQRLSLSKDKRAIIKLSKQGQTIENEKDIIKDPYVLEFLGLPERPKYSEKDLERSIITNLQKFLLELGKGFAFIASQYRITLNNTHYYIDLVFYHRILKCFVLIDLKIREAKHHDIGQMNMYLNYFKKEENMEDDNSPVGIILVAAKDEIMVEYATGGLSNNVFISKYQTYLPDKKLLEEEIRKLLEEEE